MGDLHVKEKPCSQKFPALRNVPHHRGRPGGGAAAAEPRFWTGRQKARKMRAEKWKTDLESVAGGGSDVSAYPSTWVSGGQVSS